MSDCVTPWTTAYQASLSMGFSGQEHWSGLPFHTQWLPLCYNGRMENCNRDHTALKAYVLFSSLGKSDGEGNGNPLQCSCPENPRDRETWWAAIYGVAQSQTRLKWLSSSSREKWIFVSSSSLFLLFLFLLLEPLKNIKSTFSLWTIKNKLRARFVHWAIDHWAPV